MREISHDFPDLVSRALMADGISVIVACMSYPQDLRTTDGFRTVTSARQMADVVSDTRACLMGLGTPDPHRDCDWAEADATGETITGEHMTDALRGGSFAIAPVRSRMILRRKGGAWRGDGNCAEASNRAFSLLSPGQLRALAEGPP